MSHDVAVCCPLNRALLAAGGLSVGQRVLQRVLLRGDLVGPSELWTVLPAVAGSVAVARRMVAEWLDSLCWPGEERMDIRLAVNEAVANVVDHAYSSDVPGQVRLYAWEAVEPRSRQRRIVAVVTDFGRWKPAEADPGYRGRGLLMMDECTHSLQIEPSSGGTSVIMTSAATRMALQLDSSPVAGCP